MPRGWMRMHYYLPQVTIRCTRKSRWSLGVEKKSSKHADPSLRMTFRFMHEIDQKEAFLSLALPTTETISAFLVHPSNQSADLKGIPILLALRKVHDHSFHDLRADAPGQFSDDTFETGGVCHGAVVPGQNVLHQVNSLVTSKIGRTHGCLCDAASWDL